MTDKKKQIEAGSVELSEEELSKAEGGGIIFIPIGSVKTKEKAETAETPPETKQGFFTDFDNR